MVSLAALVRTRKRPNAVSFRFSEWHGFRRKEGESAAVFVERMIRNRFTKAEYERRFHGPEDLVKACHELAVSVAREKDPLDRAVLAEFDRLPAGDFDAAAALIRDLRQGYREREVSAEATEIKSEIVSQLETTRSLIERTRALLRRGAIKKQKHKRSIFEDSLRRLVALRKELRGLDPEWEARRRLFQPRLARYFRSISVLEANWDASLRSTQLRWCDPTRLDFPLRFLVNQPLNVFIELERLWQQGRSGPELLKLIAPQVLKAETLSGLVAAARTGIIATEPWRIAVLEELRRRRGRRQARIGWAYRRDAMRGSRLVLCPAPLR